jgi:Uma2 family endonuclease
MGEAALKRITVDEFLSWDGDPNQRYELISGEIVAMSPPSNRHALIAANVIGEIRQRIAPPCKVLSEAGVHLSWRDDAYYQPDIAVTCSSLNDDRWGVPDPVVIVDVVSPSTKAHDRSVKLVDYRHIASVREIVLVSNTEKRVEHWRRVGNGWSVLDLEATDHISLDVIGFDIPVEALYEGLDLPKGADAPEVADV